MSAFLRYAVPGTEVILGLSGGRAALGTVRQADIEVIELIEPDGDTLIIDWMVVETMSFGPRGSRLLEMKRHRFASHERPDPSPALSTEEIAELEVVVGAET